MKKIFTLVVAFLMILTLVACSNGNGADKSNASNASQNGSQSAVQEGTGTQKQGNDSSKVECKNSNIKNGTAVTLKIGDTVIPAVLNDTTTAKDLISRLPYTVSLHKYTHDFCGVMSEPLAYDKDDVQYGWKNGDIHFATDGPYFVLFFADEDISQKYGYQVHIGHMDVDFDVLKKLDSNIDVRIELAK